MSLINLLLLTYCLVNIKFKTMIINFIELDLSKIYNRKTEEYFKEVISDFQIGSYRSAIVSLHSVLICDLTYKIKELGEIHEDENAKEILDEIKRLNKEHPTSSDWEKYVLKKIEVTSLFEPGDKINVDSLRSHRHLCAHPIFEEDYSLYTPNSETTRAHIVNMYKIFCNPPIFVSKIFNKLLDDLAKNKETLLYDDEILNNYITNKYLKYSNISKDKQIFKSLWKVAFNDNNSLSEENRNINYKVLNIYFKKRKSELTDFILKDITFFEQKLKGNPSQYLIKFVSENSSIISILPSIKLCPIINSEIQSSKISKGFAWFMNNNITNHLLFINECLDKLPDYGAKERLLYSDAYQILENIFIAGNIKEVIKFGIERYSKSRSFREADDNYFYLIWPRLKNYGEQNFNDLIGKSSLNDQCFGRNRAKSDFDDVRKIAMGKGFNIDFSKIDNLI